MERLKAETLLLLLKEAARNLKEDDLCGTATTHFKRDSALFQALGVQLMMLSLFIRPMTLNIAEIQ